MKLLAHNSEKIQYLVNALNGCNLLGQEEIIAQKVISDIYKGNVYNLAMDLRKHFEKLQGVAIVTYQTMPMNELLKKVAGSFEVYLCVRKNFDPAESERFFIEVKFLFDQIYLTGYSDLGAANRMVRRFGITCDKMFLLEMLKSFYTNKSTEVEIKLNDALSEGYSARIGPTIVTRNHVVEESTKVVDLLVRLASLCQIKNPSEKITREILQSRDKLIEATGPIFAEKWFRDNFPHLVGDTD